MNVEDLQVVERSYQLAVLKGNIDIDRDYPIVDIIKQDAILMGAYEDMEVKGFHVQDLETYRQKQEEMKNELSDNLLRLDPGSLPQDRELLYYHDMSIKEALLRYTAEKALTATLARDLELYPLLGCNNQE